MRVASFVLPALLLISAVLQVRAQQTAPAPTDPTSSAPSAQQSTTPPPSTPPSGAGASQSSDKDKPKPDQAGEGKSGTSKDRLFYALPNFLTLENAGQVPPLTSGQKFKVVAKGSFDYIQLPWYAFLAGISQAEDSEKGYGQGAEGYGKRLGSYIADGTIENFMTGAILPSLLHQDPRYFQSGKGGFFHRTGYAVTRILVTRQDSGRNAFNYSEVFGSAISAGISTFSYHPREDRNIGNALSVWGSQVGYDTITLTIKEFWPDIRRKMQKKKRQQALLEIQKIQ